jgi:hypothetical protein
MRPSAPAEPADEAYARPSERPALMKRTGKFVGFSDNRLEMQS